MTQRKRGKDRDWCLTHLADGCNLHAACLTCPLPQCQFDTSARKEKIIANLALRTMAKE
mgnify:CR=1 FL=1